MTGQMSAKELTPQQALTRLVTGNTSSKVVAKARRANINNKMELTYTSTLGTTNTYYVFDNNQSGGYVILSADDTMPAVLGYVDQGRFDYNNIPDNMKWYLSMLNYTVRSHSRRGVLAKTLEGKSAVEPLLGATQWDQGKPFNLETPEYEYGKNGKEQAYVGCAACAAAQVMRYHKYPAQGTGDLIYKFVWDCKEGVDQQVATDSTVFSSVFSDHSYDWDNMLDKYTNDPVNWNEQQGNAVSLLLKDVGVASKMRYGTDASGGSGTSTVKVASGLVDHFGYDASLQYVDHKFYTSDEWQEMTYNELAAARLVIFGGRGADGTGGHEFVGDGYDGNGKFHINWGWSGMHDGYFVLTGPGMVPGGSGAGGAGDGASYGYGMDALINVMPSNAEGATGKEADCRLATVGYTAKVDGMKLTLTGTFYNTSYHTQRDTAGIQLQAADETCYNFVDGPCTISPASTMGSIDVTIGDATPAGEYTITPIMKGPNDENWAAIKVLSTFKAATLTVTEEDGKKSISVTNNDAPKIEAQGAVTANKSVFRPTKKNAEGKAEDAETLVLTCEAGIKNCDEKGQKLSFGCEFYDLTESNDSTDVYWLTNYAKTNADELAAGASIKTISVEILPELEAGHSYEVNPIFYVGVDESLDDDAYFDALDAVAQYVNLGDNEAPVIEIEGDGDDPTAIKTVEQPLDGHTTIYDIQGRTITAQSISALPQGTYILKDARGIRKIVRK